ncbi:MAG: PAS domain S-box protein, partial [Methanocalculus sp.]|uniref:sensor histidine kinase n=1 Tax=Methanocalculus sp. TaxID=2004547 RepID=UPI002728A570
LTNVYPHLYYIPIILAAYRFNYPGILYGALLATLYFIIHLIMLPEPEALLDAGIRTLIMITVGTIIGTLSLEKEESEERYCTLFESIDEGIIICDLFGRIRIMNPAAADLLSVHPQESEGENICDLISHTTPDCDCEKLSKIMKKGRFTYQTSLPGESGEVKTCEIRGSRILIGEIASILLVIHDTSERHRAEEMRRRLAAIVEASDDAIISISPERLILTWNKSAERIYGWAAEEIIGQPVSLVIPKEERKISYRYYTEVISTGTAQRLEVNRIHKSGRKLRISLSISPVLDEEGNVIAISGIMRDITERIRMEEELKRSVEFYRTLFYGTSTPTALINSDNRIILANDGFFRLIGGEYKQRSFPEMITDERRGDITRILSECHCKGSYSIRRSDCSIIGGDGGERVLCATFAPLPESKQVIASLIDITKEQKLVQRLSESLEEKDTLLKEIHHRVKNNMQIISSLLHLQSLTLESNQLAEVFRESENRITSMALVHETLYRSENLARIDAEKYIRQLVGEVVDSYAPEQDISIEYRIDGIPLEIDYAIHIGLIINELLSNALKHAFIGHEKGKITIYLERDAGGYITLSVKDDGVGLPQGFDPAHTKTLGIELLMTLVRQLRGESSWYTPEKGGTRFITRFREVSDP